VKYTLLDMTQSILSSMSSDEVNSISDTAESLQVANIIKTKYYDIVSRGDLPEHNQVFQLSSSLTADQPTLMTVPDGVGKIEWIKYFNAEEGTLSDPGSSIHDTDTDLTSSSSTISTTAGYQYVTMLPIRQFLDMINLFNPTDDTVGSFQFADASNTYAQDGPFTFYYKNNVQPRFCCVLSNFYVIFDAYNSDLDTTLQTSKTMCYGQVVPTFSMVDSFTPDLDSQQFPLLLNEAKSLAFYELKQQPHQLAMQETKRQWSTVQKNKSLNNRPTYFNELPNYGRQGGGLRSGSSYFKARGWDVN
jgi:hypothetical protein